MLKACTKHDNKCAFYFSCSNSKEEVISQMEGSRGDIGLVQTKNTDEVKHLKSVEDVLSLFLNTVSRLEIIFFSQNEYYPRVTHIMELMILFITVI